MNCPWLNKVSFIHIEYADVFRGEGKLEGDLHLEIDPNVPPVQLPTLKVPIAIKEKLKEELNRWKALISSHQ